MLLIENAVIKICKDYPNHKKAFAQNFAESLLRVVAASKKQGVSSPNYFYALLRWSCTLVLAAGDQLDEWLSRVASAQALLLSALETTHKAGGKTAYQAYEHFRGTLRSVSIE